MSQRKARGAQGGGAPRRTAPGAHPRLYTLQVSLFSGPVTERFVAANPVMARTLQIRGDQTLEDLHRVIFRAFDREEEHLYEFRFGRGPYDQQAPLYVHPVVAAQEAELLGRPPAGVVTQTRLDSLGLRVGRSFGYWFDMGDEWGHQVEVLNIAPEVPPGPFPRVVGRIGASPPQYVDWDAEERDSLAAPATGAGPRGRKGSASAEQPPTRFALLACLPVPLSTEPPSRARSIHVPVRKNSPPRPLSMKGAVTMATVAKQSAMNSKQPESFAGCIDLLTRLTDGLALSSGSWLYRGNPPGF